MGAGRPGRRTIFGAAGFTRFAGVLITPVRVGVLVDEWRVPVVVFGALEVVFDEIGRAHV